MNFHSVEIEVYLESLEIFLATTASIGVMAGIIMIMITLDDDNFPRERHKRSCDGSIKN